MKSDFTRIVDLVRFELGFSNQAKPLQENEGSVWRLARDHKVGAILAAKIVENNSPTNLVDEARYVWQLGALREKYYTQKSQEIISNFHSHNVRAFPLKGVVLASEVYPKRGFRPFRDVDLLVQAQQLERADQILSEEGFQEIFPTSPLQRAVRTKGSSLEAAQKGIDAISFQKDDLFVEVHTRIVPPMLGEYSLDHVWDQAQDRLTPEDFMAHLLIHATRHHFLYGLRHLVDMALWSQKVRSMEIVRDRLEQNKLFWLAWPAWKLAAHFFPESISEPQTQRNRRAVRYTSQIEKNMAIMPFKAIALSGTPIPFVWMKGRLIRSFWGSKEIQRYQVGEGKNSFHNLWWKIKRPFALIWRHAPVVRTLLQMRFFFF